MDQLNPEALNRRSTDDKGENHTRERRFEERLVVEPRPDTYTKWVVGVVGAGIISALTVLAVRDRASIDSSLNTISKDYGVLNGMVVSHETQIQVIKTRQERVLSDLQEIRKALETQAQLTTDNSRKLDVLLKR